MHTLILAGNTETNPRASMIVGVICIAAVIGAVLWIARRLRRR